MSNLEKPYGRRNRPGHHITRTAKHPRRQARRERAAAREAAHVHGPMCKRNRVAA